jgi:mono/diheme cytochrome c family protein
MRRIALLCPLIFIVTSCTAKAPLAPEQDFQPRPNYLTMGNAVAGRTAFLELKCNTCHAVAGERLNGRAPGRGGPGLGTAEALQSPDEIARSIAAPGHAISDEAGPWRENGKSRMPDYAQVMTVRQLMDLVAYIRSLPRRRT